MGYMNYEERLEVAKRLYELSNAEQKTALECIFPELCEPEDERIKKLLVEAVTQVLQDQYCSNRGVSKEKVVAWLEKQETSYTKKDVDDAYVEGMAFAKNELEKQGSEENKGNLGGISSNSAWSEEDKKMIEAAINLAHEYGRHGLWVWLKSLKERYTWKPSDEQMEALNQAKTDACGKPYFNALASLYVNLQS